MQQKAVAALTVELVLRYYENDVQPFLDHMDEDALWCGPAEGQLLRGRASMVSAWAAENHGLTFSVGDVRTATTAAGPAQCVVLMYFPVVTHYPSGNDISINQRVAMTWCERAVVDADGARHRVPRILLCCVTNPHPKSSEDTIYPVHFEQVFSGFVSTPEPGERLHFPGVGSEEFYLFSDSILWGDSCGQGRRCALHLADGTVAEVRRTVRDIVADHPGHFLRCHSSHFVNPRYVKSVRRFAVTMLGGVELPIPEKSYTAFKQALQAMV